MTVITTREYENRAVAVIWHEKTNHVHIDFFMNGKKLEKVYFPEEYFNEILSFEEKFKQKQLPECLDEIASSLEKFLPVMSAERNPIPCKHWKLDIKVPVF